MYNFFQPQPMGQSFQQPLQGLQTAFGQPPMGQPPQYDVIRVNGENGARAFRMAPNSRCLLLDETAPIVWLAQTDGAGYPQLTPYTITPYHPQSSEEDLNQRLERLEAIIYGKPGSSDVERNPRVPQRADADVPTAQAISAVPSGTGSASAG